MTPRLVVMGVSGGGKSTVPSALAARLGLASVDGDDLHPQADVATMRSGRPLDDADRWPWLALVADRPLCSDGVVLACSASKRACRDRIRQKALPDLRFVFLAAVDVTGRLGARPGHFMPPALMESQFAALERPGMDEADVLTVAAGRPVHGVIEEIGGRLATRAAPGAERHG